MKIEGDGVMIVAEVIRESKSQTSLVGRKVEVGDGM